MVDLKINKEFESLIRPLTEEELSALEGQLLSEGIRDAICVWNDTIIDGHHRYRLAKKHNLDFKTKEYNFKNEDEVKLWMILNQRARRNLRRIQALDLCLNLKSIIEKQIREEAKERKTFVPITGEELTIKPTDEEWSNKTRCKIAEMAAQMSGGDRVGHGTVWTLEQVKSKADQKTIDKVLSGELPLGKAYKAIRKEEKLKAVAERQKLLAKKFKDDNAIQIHNADFYPWCNENLEENSIDLILTDPPYPKEFLYLWEQLSEVASRVLKIGGYLAAYSGQLHLNEVMRLLETHLDYCWTISLYHTQNTQVVHARNVVCTWKPILIYRKGRAGKIETYTGRALVDSILDDYREKDFHEWGQGESAVAYLMKALSDVDQLVLEPFAGGGTTLAVAKKLKRKCIGIEIDKNYIDIIKANIMKPENTEIIL